MKSYTVFNYQMAFIILLIILGFGVFEWLTANLKIALILTLPLLLLLFFLKNTYQVKNNHVAVSTFGKTHRKIWLRDIVKVEEGKTLFGKKMAKVYYDPYQYVSVKLGGKTGEFIEELKGALK